MTKTKLQIMREKADMTIEQLAIFALIIQYENRWCYPSTLETFKETIDGTIKVLEKFEKTNTNIDRSNKNWKYIAQALGCSVDELVEDEG